MLVPDVQGPQSIASRQLGFVLVSHFQWSEGFLSRQVLFHGHLSRALVLALQQCKYSNGPSLYWERSFASLIDVHLFLASREALSMGSICGSETQWSLTARKLPALLQQKAQILDGGVIGMNFGMTFTFAACVGFLFCYQQ